MIESLLLTIRRILKITKNFFLLQVISKSKVYTTSNSKRFFIINNFISYTMSVLGKRLSGSFSFHPLKRNTSTSPFLL